MKIYNMKIENKKKELIYNTVGMLDVDIKGIGIVTMEFKGEINCINENDKQDFQFEFSFSNSYLSDYVDKIRKFARDEVKQLELYGLVKDYIMEFEV